MNTALTFRGEQELRGEGSRPGLWSARGRSVRGRLAKCSEGEGTRAVGHSKQADALVGLKESSVSWSSLVATTLGLDDYGRVWVRVRAAVPGNEACRLVVQLYPAAAAEPGVAIQRYARPLASAQRAVTPEELRQGLEVMLVHWMSGHPAIDETVLIAWVEPGEADLEFDGLRARPAQTAYVGMCRPEHERASIVLERSAA